MKPKTTQTLGVFLALGESFSSLKKQGQHTLMISQNIAAYARIFKQVYVFTYARELTPLPPRCRVISPPRSYPRYLYSLLLPWLHRDVLKQIDLIRCFQLSGTIPAIIAKILWGKKFVFNLGYDYVAFARIEGRPVQSLLFRLLQPLAMHLADGVIVKNKLLLKRLSHKLKAKCIYLPNGVDIKQFHPHKAPNHLITQSPHKLNILFVGRLEPQKNLPTLLQAVANLNPKVKLIIVGNGSQRQKIVALAKALNISLQLITKVVHPQLVSIYHQADIFVLPSLAEGSAKVLLEAMACGLVCVATNIAENQELITHNQHGILCSSDSEHLTQALQTLITEPATRLKLGVNARKKVITHFDSHKLMAQEIKFLRAL